MNDQLDTAVRTALRDIIAAAPTADRRPTPIELVDSTGDRPRRGVYLAVAAAVVVMVGVAGVLSIDSKRSGPAATAARPNGEIIDPRAIDLSPWLSGAPEWPGYPQSNYLERTGYLVFDIAALDGWTKLDESGGHQIADGYSYVWGANVSDPDGREFHLATSNSLLYPHVVSGDLVDINGVDGTSGEGEVSWALDDTHVASVTEFGTTSNQRAIALARQLTTTTISRISVGGLGSSPELRVDPAAPFAGVIDGVAWSASATPDSMTFIVDQTFSATYGSSHAEITQSGNNDLCVLISGYLPDAATNARLVLSDKTTIALPTQRLENGEFWFAACLPYALDVTFVEVGSRNDEPVLHRLNWPLLQPSLGQVATDTDLSTEALAKSLIGANDEELNCGTTFADQAVMVASAPRADGNRLQLWIAPTSTGATNDVLITLAHNGAMLTISGGCPEREDSGAFFSVTSEERVIDMVGRTDPSATRALVTFTSGRTVVVDVQSDGYFILSIIDDDDYGQYKSVWPVD